MIKTFSQHLVLWLHLLFVAFTIGPVTVAIMSTPRYIRQRDLRIVRYLNRTTFIFALTSLGVLIAGEALASMISVAAKPWVIVSATLFIVALVLLALIMRDQRKAIRALEDAAAGAPVTVAPAATTGPGAAESDLADEPGAIDPGAGVTAAGVTAAGVTAAGVTAAGVTAAGVTAAPATPDIHLASVERGRIAMMGGVVGVIWLVILVLMVWH
jgi:hypothetical protein